MEIDIDRITEKTITIGKPLISGALVHINDNNQWAIYKKGRYVEQEIYHRGSWVASMRRYIEILDIEDGRIDIHLGSTLDDDLFILADADYSLYSKNSESECGERLLCEAVGFLALSFRILALDDVEATIKAIYKDISRGFSISGKKINKALVPKLKINVTTQDGAYGSVYEGPYLTIGDCENVPCSINVVNNL